ncbi:caspase domain-containing protein [Hypoxylon trugodes]|uniref:caspase domain-containing protein n=1 Tax=Hypoxylon trugodes TaxID=326681 RepID=UPI00218D1C9A|nr:caspase domain-containing protein [Hypoxylon trugodes]KAI1384156.1 caspase domain-containing protein [Hypoxylon trugodes]
MHNSSVFSCINITTRPRLGSSFSFLLSLFVRISTIYRLAQCRHRILSIIPHCNTQNRYCASLACSSEKDLEKHLEAVNAHMSDKGKRPKKWALLIGVNFYVPGDARHPVHARSLFGCVNDVGIVYDYFVQQQGFEENRIERLTSTHPPTVDEGTKKTSPEPIEERRKRPSYKNIIGALTHILEQAECGDIVFIHYAGHGARAITLIPHIKKPNPDRPNRPGVDETLVPYDFNLGGRYVRDIEIAVLLKAMVEKQLYVTMVLDCCHSGGDDRDPGNEAGVRKIGGTDAEGIDWRQLPGDTESDIGMDIIKSALTPEIWAQSSVSDP